MSDLKNPDIRAGAEAFKICRDGIRGMLGDNALFIDPLRKFLDTYFISLNTRKASRKSFKKKGGDK